MSPDVDQDRAPNGASRLQVSRRDKRTPVAPVTPIKTTEHFQLCSSPNKSHMSFRYNIPMPASSHRFGSRSPPLHNTRVSGKNHILFPTTFTTQRRLINDDP